MLFGCCCMFDWVVLVIISLVFLFGMKVRWMLGDCLEVVVGFENSGIVK